MGLFSVPVKLGPGFPLFFFFFFGRLVQSLLPAGNNRGNFCLRGRRGRAVMAATGLLLALADG